MRIARCQIVYGLFIMVILWLAAGEPSRLSADILANAMSLLIARSELAGVDALAMPCLATQSDMVEQTLSECHVQLLARWQYLRGDYLASESSYKAALAQAPGNRLIQFELGNIYAVLGRDEDAIQMWRKAGSAAYWINRSKELLQRNSTTAALECLGRAQRVAPTDAQVHFEAGQVFSRMEEWEQAIEAFSVAIQNRTGDEVWLYDAYVNRGRAYLNESQFAQAEEDFLQALSFRSTDPWVYIRLSELYRIQRRLDDALTCAQTGVQLAPRSAYAHYYLGAVWFSRGQLEVAVTEFTMALRLDSTLSAAARGLDRALRLMNTQ